MKLTILICVGVFGISTQTFATDMGIGSSMQCDLVSKDQKVIKAKRSPASDLSKLKTFTTARKACNKDYPGSYPVNIQMSSNKGQNYIQFDCQSCFTFAKNEADKLKNQKPNTVTGKAPEEAWLSTVAEAR